MELRKIQRTSSGTFFVCLPKNWAQRNGLDRGSLVTITESADRLVIGSRYKVERTPKEAVIRPTSLLDREIVEKYLLGYDVIQVEAKERISLSDRERVKQASSRLIGLEIIEEDYSKIVLQCLLQPAALHPEKVLLREYSIASGMHRDSVTALIEGDIHLAKNVISRDNEVNRLYFLLVRILRTIIQNPNLSEKLGILPIDCLDYRLTASLVEAIGDQSAQIAEKVIRLEGLKIFKELAQLIFKFSNFVQDSHEDSIRSLFSHHVSDAEAVRETRKVITDLYNEIEKIANTQPIDAVPHILAAVSSINLIYDHSVDIADLVMSKPV